MKGAEVVGVAAFATIEPEDCRSYFESDHGEWVHQCSFKYDTTFDNCWDYFQLFQRHSVESVNHFGDTVTVDTLDVIASKRMHVLDTNVIGYFDRQAYETSPRYEPYVPIRAVYFDSAVTVNGEFWVGGNVQNSHRDYVDSTGHFWPYYTWPIDYGRVQYPCGYMEDCFHDTILFSGWVYYLDSIEWSILDYTGFIPVFPLFCELPTYPSPLSQWGDGGSSADVPPVLSPSDFVTLAPNPATTEATVLSSTGIGNISVYDITGRKVYEAQGGGIQTTLPVADWPAGTYVVHVDTPLGLAVKKLEISR